MKIEIASIRANYELWRKSEIDDGAFSWHLHNSLLRIEKALDSNDALPIEFVEWYSGMTKDKILKAIKMYHNENCKELPNRRTTG